MPGKPEFESSELSLWFTQKNLETASRNLITLAETGDLDNDYRRSRAVYNLSIIEAMGVSGFGAWGYGGPSTGQRGATCVSRGGKKIPIVWNYAAAGLDTLASNVIGQDETKPMLIVTDGDYDDHRQSVWSTRLLEGLYRTDQGMYRDVWDLARSAFRIAAGCTGTVAVKVQPLPHEKKLTYEIHDTLDMVIDAFECSYSMPLTYLETTWFDAHRLMAGFDDQKLKQMIWDSREPLPAARGGEHGQRDRMMVRLVEGHRLKMGTDDGVYMAAVSKGCLLRKPYLHSTPPYAFLHARRSTCGFFGTPIMERGMRIVERINQILASLDKTERLLPKNVAVFDTNAVSPEFMRNIQDALQLPYSSATNPHAVPPTYLTPQVYDETVMNLLNAHIRAFQETMGISANQMGGTKEQGVVAAVAIRATVDIFTKLFAIEARDAQKFVTSDIGGLTLRAINDMREDPEFKDFPVTWDGGKFMKSVKTSCADLKDKKFIIQIAPVSGTHNSPQDRMALADEMLSRQELTPAGYQRVLETGDVPAESRKQKRQEAMIERFMDSWMYDDLSDIQTVSPLPWMNLDEAIVQVLDGYMAALMVDKFPPARELYFRRYISQADQMAQRQQTSKAQLSGLAKGKGTAPEIAPGVGQQPS